VWLSQSDLANQRRAEPTRADFAEGLSRKSRKFSNFVSHHHLKVDVYKLRFFDDYLNGIYILKVHLYISISGFY